MITFIVDNVEYVGLNMDFLYEKIAFIIFDDLCDTIKFKEGINNPISILNFCMEQNKLINYNDLCKYILEHYKYDVVKYNKDNYKKEIEIKKCDEIKDKLSKIIFCYMS